MVQIDASMTSTACPDKTVCKERWESVSPPPPLAFLQNSLPSLLISQLSCLPFPLLPTAISPQLITISASSFSLHPPALPPQTLCPTSAVTELARSQWHSWTQNTQPAEVWNFQFQIDNLCHFLFMTPPRLSPPFDTLPNLGETRSGPSSVF